MRRFGDKYFAWCRRCVQKTPEVSAAISKAQTGKKATPKTPESRSKISAKLRERWQDPRYRELKEQQIEKQWSSEEFKRRHLKASLASEPARRNSLAKIQKSIDAKKSVTMKRKWQNPEYRAKAMAVYTVEMRKRIGAISKARYSTEEGRAKMAAIAREAWCNPSYREQAVERMRVLSNELQNNPEFRQKVMNYWTPERRDEASQKSREYYRQHPEALLVMSLNAQKQWQSDEYKKWAQTFWTPERRLRQSLISQENSKIAGGLFASSLEDIVAYYLTDNGIRFIRQHIVNEKYVFDFYLPDQNVLLEIQGLKFHHPEHALRPAALYRDKAKRTYIANHTEYELVYLWEDQMYQISAIRDLINDICDLPKEPPTQTFDFDSVVIKEIPSTVCNTFVVLYHYLERARRGGIAYGAYLGEKLIGVVYYVHPMVPDAAASIGLDIKEVREVARFCIHPAYHQQNFGSFLLAKTRKLLKTTSQHLVALIAYADTTVGHSGGLYQASGFEFVSEVAPDYWYEKDGRKVHKRTLWRMAQKLSKSEIDFAQIHGYTKVWGDKKRKFVYWYT